MEWEAEILPARWKRLRQHVEPVICSYVVVKRGKKTLTHGRIWTRMTRKNSLLTSTDLKHRWNQKGTQISQPRSRRSGYGWAVCNRLKTTGKGLCFQGTGRNDQGQDRIRYGFPQNSRKADKLRQRSISWQGSDWNYKNIWTAKSTIKDNGVKQWSGSWHKWGAIVQNEIFEHTFQGKNNLVANVHVKVSCPAIGKKVP